MITGHRLKGPRINIAWETEQPEPNEASIDWYKVSTLLSFSFLFVYFQLFFNAMSLIHASELYALHFSFFFVLLGPDQKAGTHHGNSVHHQQTIHRPAEAQRGRLCGRGPGTHRGRRRSRRTNQNSR